MSAGFAQNVTVINKIHSPRKDLSPVPSRACPPEAAAAAAAALRRLSSTARTSSPASTARTAWRCRLAAAFSRDSCVAAPWTDRFAPGREEKRRVLPRPLVGSGCVAVAPADALPDAPPDFARGAARRLKSTELAGDGAGDPKCCCIMCSKPARSSSMCRRFPLRFSRFSLSETSCSAAAKRSFALFDACACPAFALSAASCESRSVRGASQSVRRVRMKRT